MKKLKFKKEEVVEAFRVLPPEGGVVLVGDQGIYLMPEKFVDELRRRVVYAAGTNPDVDEDWYDEKRNLYGGDDGVDTVGTVEEILRIAKAAKKFVIVNLSETEIEVTHD